MPVLKARVGTALALAILIMGLLSFAVAADAQTTATSTTTTTATSSGESTMTSTTTPGLPETGVGGDAWVLWVALLALVSVLVGGAALLTQDSKR